MAKALRVLVVEDDEDQQNLLKLALEHAGHSVAAEVTRGDDPRLREPPECDVAIVDLTLPGASGVEVIRTLLDARAYLPVLVLSSSAHSAAITEALLAGALGYVVKGGRLADLVDAVDLVSARKPALSPQVKTVLESKSGADVDAAIARVKRWL